MTVRAAVLGERRQAFVGTSSDTKPVQGIAPGSLFTETDTKKVYVWGGDGHQGTSAGWVWCPAEVWLKGDFIDTTLGVADVVQGPFDYEAVSTSATDQAMGTGAVGDFLHAVIVQVTTSGANGTCSIKDGSGSAIPLVPASTPIGVYTIVLNIRSTGGAWKITTGSAATALGIGIFTP